MDVFLACNTFTGNKTAFMGIPHEIHEVYYFLPTNMPQFLNCLLYFFTFLLHTAYFVCRYLFHCNKWCSSFSKVSNTRFYERFFSNQAFLSIFILIFQNFPFWICYMSFDHYLLTYSIILSLLSLHVQYALDRISRIFPRFFSSAEGSFAYMIYWTHP
jgi:uncharacterized membrane protein YbhN (UPF0104 family)